MSNGSDALPLTGSKEYGSKSAELRSFVRSILLKGVRTSMPVEVVSVTNNGGVEPIGFVDVQPLVQQIDANGKLKSHAVIYNVPYQRIQGGTNAVILDPEVGDIGMASFCDRDISTVKETEAQSGPGSARTFNMSDAIYLGTVLSSTTPEQYVQFNSSGITVHSPSKVTVEAPEVLVDSPQSTFTGAVLIQGPLTYQGGMTGSGGSGAAAQINGSVSATGDVTAGSISLNSHTHPGDSGGETGPPNS